METYRTQESIHARFNDHDSTFGFADPEDHREDAIADGFPYLRSVGYSIHDPYDGAEIAFGPTWEGVVETVEKMARAHAEACPSGSWEGAWESFWDGLVACMWTTWSDTPKPEPRRRFRLF